MCVLMCECVVVTCNQKVLSWAERRVMGCKVLIEVFRNRDINQLLMRCEISCGSLRLVRVRQVYI